MRVTLKIRLLLRRLLRPAVHRAVAYAYLLNMLLLLVGENFTWDQFIVLWRAVLIICLCMCLVALM